MCGELALAAQVLLVNDGCPAPRHAHRPGLVDNRKRRGKPPAFRVCGLPGVGTELGVLNGKGAHRAEEQSRIRRLDVVAVELTAGSM